MNDRADKELLLARLADWDSFLRRRVRLIACGGTALTLLNIKASTKDIDLIVPEIGEYEYLVRTLDQLGYKSVSGSGLRRGLEYSLTLTKERNSNGK